MKIARAETGWRVMPMPQSKDNEIVAAPQNDRRHRRQWSVEDKRRIIEEADRCTERGQIAALLRREGIYSAQLSQWRAQIDAAVNEGLTPKKPGRKPIKDAKDKRIEKLEKKNAKLEKELDLARKLIDLQKKAHEIFGVALPKIEDDEAR